MEQVGRKPLRHAERTSQSTSSSGTARETTMCSTLEPKEENSVKYLGTRERESVLSGVQSKYGDCADAESSIMEDISFDQRIETIQRLPEHAETLYFASDLDPSKIKDGQILLNNNPGTDYSSSKSVEEKHQNGCEEKAISWKSKNSQNTERYNRIPEFTDSSPLDKTGRFGKNYRSSNNIERPSSAHLKEYAVKGNAVEREMREELQHEHGQSTKKYLKTISKLKDEAENKFVKDHPFAPAIQDSKNSSEIMSRPLSGRDINAQIVGGGRFLPISRTGRPKQEELVDRIQKVRDIHEKSLQKREADKKLLDRAELQLCTFKPQISKGSERIISKQRAGSQGRISACTSAPSPGKPCSTVATRMFAEEPPPPPPGSGCEAAAERLFREAWTRKAEALERSKRLREINNQNYSFHPSINISSEEMLKRSESEYRPIQERLGDIQRARNSCIEHSIAAQVCV